MTKFLVAAVTAAAVVGSAFAASAAPAQSQPAPQPAAAEPFRLDDAQMDTVSAGGLIGDINLAIVIPVQVVTVNNIALAFGDGAIANAVNVLVVEQTTKVTQRIRNR